jgi:AAA+ superfamily predicted ATPase
VDFQVLEQYLSETADESEVKGLVAGLSEKDREGYFDRLIFAVKTAPVERKLLALKAALLVKDWSEDESIKVLLAIRRYLLKSNLEGLAFFDELMEMIARISSRQIRFVGRGIELLLLILRNSRKPATYLRLQPPIRCVLGKLIRDEVDFSPDLFIRAGDRLLHAKHDQEALDALSIGLFYYPFNVALLDLRGSANVAMGNFINAKDDLDRIIELEPKNHQYYARRGEVCLMSEQYEEALRDFNVFLRKYKKHQRVMSLKADALASSGRNYEALKVYDVLLKIDPKNAEFLFARARLYDSLEASGEAIADLEKALELKRDFPEAKYYRQQMIMRRSNLGAEDELYTAYVTGNEDLVFGDRKQNGERFSDIGGLTEAKETIREVIEYPLRYPEISAKFGKKAGGGVLFFGPPGCGKTLLARAAANECGLFFLNVNLSSVLDKWVGNTEKAVSMVFKMARKRAPSILFFDELDALGAARERLHSGWEKKVISQLLVEMDGLESQNEQVMILGATNAPWEVDLALRRAGRFGRFVFVPPPDLPAREEVLRIYCARKPLMGDDVDFKALAEVTEHHSADSLRQLVEDAANIPWKEAIRTGVERPISMSDFTAALEKRKPDLAEWNRLVRRYEEFARQVVDKVSIGFLHKSAPKRSET